MTTPKQTAEELAGKCAKEFCDAYDSTIEEYNVLKQLILSTLNLEQLVKDGATLADKCDEAIDKLVVSDSCWDEGERIVTANGTPIGCTISNRIEADRWWPSLQHEIKCRIRKTILNAINQQNQPK